MLRAAAVRRLAIVAAGFAVVMSTSTASAVVPQPMGGEPRDPEGPVSAELLPTPADDAADALAAWIAGNPNAGAGGTEVLRDRKAVVVYWKGTPPAGLQKLAAAQPVPVTFKTATYSYAELEPIAKKLVADHNDVVDSAGPSGDYSGISVTLKPTAPSATLDQLKADAGVPVTVDGVADSVDLNGRSTAAQRHNTNE